MKVFARPFSKEFNTVALMYKRAKGRKRELKRFYRKVDRDFPIYVKCYGIDEVRDLLGDLLNTIAINKLLSKDLRKTHEEGLSSKCRFELMQRELIVLRKYNNLKNAMQGLKNFGVPNLRAAELN